MNFLSFYQDISLGTQGGLLAQAARDAETGGIGGWILLGVVVVLGVFAFRTFNKASVRRLQGGGSGAETESEREQKRAARKARKEQEAKAKQERQEAAKERAQRDADSDSEAEAPKRSGKPKGKKKGKSGNPAARGKKGKVEAPKPEKPKPELLLPEGKSLEQGLLRTRKDGFVGRLGKLFSGKQLDESLVDELEEVMFTADIGVRTSQKLLDGLTKGLKSKEISDSEKVWNYLRQEAREIFEAAGAATSLQGVGTNQPHIVLVVGVNGAGKTTTIGKLAHKCIAEGKKVTIGAGDTFRAAAVDQLEVWAKRVGANIVQGKESQDPSSVLFDAVKSAQEDGSDIVFLDTAGRLHTNKNLVAELKKVKKVINKAMPGAPHEVLLVLDGTTGQNAIAQAHTFGEEMGVTGIVVTKLDGTAKGGVVLGICDEMKLPIAWIGIGERTEDLRPFVSEDFVGALFG